MLHDGINILKINSKHKKTKTIHINSYQSCGNKKKRENKYWKNKKYEIEL